MTVKEAIEMLAYGEAYEIKGAHSGKIYHRSWVNKKEHAEQFFEEEAIKDPFYSGIRTNKRKFDHAWCHPYIGIWMHDYYICHPEERR